MKKVILIFLFTVYAFSASTFYLDIPDSTAQVAPGEVKVFEGYVHNTGSATTVLQVKRATNEIPVDWTTSICFGATCYPPYVDEASEAVDPGDSLFFDITFNTSSVPASGQAWIVFTDAVTSEKDSMLFSVSTELNKSIRISMEDTVKQGTQGESLVFEGYVHNQSDVTTVVQMYRVTNDIPANWTTSICFGATCYPPYVDNASETVDPGDSLFFDITFNSDMQAGEGSALLRFVDAISSDQIEQVFTAITVTPEPVFSVSVTDTAADTLAGQSHEFSGYVYNNSDKAQTFFMVREQNNIPAGWSTTLCFGSCPQATVDTVSSLIMNGDSLEYIVTFYSDETPADGDVLIQFYAAGEGDTVRQAFSLHTSSTAIGDTPGNTVGSFELLGNYPNPFNPTTAISYQLSYVSRVELTVYDISGKVVRNLVSERQEAGTHYILFKASHLSSGTYLYQLKANGQIKTGKMLLLK